MENETARDWALEFEGKPASEIPDVPPPGLPGAELVRWKLAQQAAKQAARERVAKEERRQWAESYRRAHPEEFDADGKLLPEFDPAVERKIRQRRQAEAAPVARPPWYQPVPAIAEDVVHAAPFPHKRAREIPRDGDTEDLLNALIAECHYLMREVALPSAIQVRDATTRAQYLGTAMSLAQTRAEVGRTIAKLRGAGAVTELRQRHFVERLVTTPAPSTEKELRT